MTPRLPIDLLADRCTPRFYDVRVVMPAGLGPEADAIIRVNSACSPEQAARVATEAGYVVLEVTERPMRVAKRLSDEELARALWPKKRAKA